MRYLKLTGYDAIVALEAEKGLQEAERSFASLGSEPVELTLFCGGSATPATARPGDTLAKLMGELGLPGEGKEVKAVHIGYPVGGIFGPGVLERPLTAELLTGRGLCPGSLEVHVLCQDTCMLDYLNRLARELQGESCGRCVFCREGLRQIHKITDDIIRAKSTQDDMDLLRLVADGMREAGHCLFGRAVGTMLLEALNEVGEDIEAHIGRKRCAAMVCKKYVTYHILGSKCKGCGKCLEVCPQEAIEGEEDYIHVIDAYECDRCGKCLEVCPHGAIVKAGAIKPKTPTEPIPVGSWRGR